MAKYNITVDPKSLTQIDDYKVFDRKDSSLINSFLINSSFLPNKNFIELHIYSLGNALLRSVTSYANYSIRGGEDTGEGSSNLEIDALEDAKAFGYQNGGVVLTYVFLNNLFSDEKFGPKLFIKEISGDRTELKLDSTNISSENLIKFTNNLREKLDSDNSFREFRINFGNNNHFIGINIDYLEEEECVTVKLYEPLPINYSIKDTLDIIEYISEPLAYEIDSTFIPDDPLVPRLREANFNLELDDNTAVPSQYFNFDELFSYKVESSNYQILSLFNEKSAEISIDHENYSDFVHFSSAEERLVNFKYKLDLVANYSSSIQNINSTLGSSGITSNITYYEDLIKGVVDNFDHYERFLYFESGSFSWPKSNSNKPYINKPSSDSESITWFTERRTAANNFDVSNFNALINTIPAFIREDTNNSQYVLFINMLAQHFDNLYIYAKAVSDKYDADNRINVGVSRDLVEEAIKSLGVKLYNSSKSLDNLFKYFIGEYTADIGEIINNNVQAGTLVAGEDTLEGTLIGFRARYEPVYKVLTNAIPETNIYLFRLTNQQLTNSDFSDGYDYTIYNELDGEDLYITFTDLSGTTHGPFKYRADTLSFGNAYYNTEPGTVNLVNNTNPNFAGTSYMIIHGFDNEDTPVDHSTLFSSITGTHTGTNPTVQIDGTRGTVSSPVSQNFQPTSQDIYQKSIYKRIYHNLSYLLKTKGTQRGLRALINCFGIPSNILDIKVYGGKDKNGPFNFGDYYSTILPGKVRLTNTGSLVEGSTLSQYTSIYKDEKELTQDLHNVEVGFSPSDNIDNLIKNYLFTNNPNFNIDDYIGDPSDLNQDSYTNLENITKEALAAITKKYDVKDFIRLIKFFDNVIFKMIKDFVPARSTVDTGIIIKSHFLERSKNRSVSGSGMEILNTGSIDTAFITGSNPGAYEAGASGSLRFDTDSAKLLANFYAGTPGEISTRRVGKFEKIFLTPESSTALKRYNGSPTDHSHDESKFDGELANSGIVISNGELNSSNTLKQLRYPDFGFNVRFFKDQPSGVCLLTDNNNIVIIGNFTSTVQHIINIPSDIFQGFVTAGTKFYFNLEGFDAQGNPINLNEATLIQGNQIVLQANATETYPQYQEFEITGYDENLTTVDNLDFSPACATRRRFKVVRCDLNIANENYEQDIEFGVGNTVNILQIFGGTDINTNFEILRNGSTVIDISEHEAYTIQEGDSSFTIRDTHDNSCFKTITFSSNACPLVAYTNEIARYGGGTLGGPLTLQSGDASENYYRPGATSNIFNVPSMFANFVSGNVRFAIQLLDNNGNEFSHQGITLALGGIPGSGHSHPDYPGLPGTPTGNPFQMLYGGPGSNAVNITTDQSLANNTFIAIPTRSDLETSGVQGQFEYETNFPATLNSIHFILFGTPAGGLDELLTQSAFDRIFYVRFMVFRDLECSIIGPTLQIDFNTTRLADPVEDIKKTVIIYSQHQCESCFNLLDTTEFITVYYRGLEDALSVRQLAEAGRILYTSQQAAIDGDLSKQIQSGAINTGDKESDMSRVYFYERTNNINFSPWVIDKENQLLFYNCENQTSYDVCIKRAEVIRNAQAEVKAAGDQAAEAQAYLDDVLNYF